MPQTFVFEELDSATREYLTAVRDAEGDGAPGIFAPTTSAMVGCGCIAGLAISIFTLVATLTTWPADLVFQEPGAVALLQTAGLLLGGWLVIAAIRSAGSKGNARYAGHWVFVDSLNLYEAYREQITVTPVEDIIEAKPVHSYDKNGTYQNSVVRIQLGGNSTAAVTLSNEAKAEQMAVFLNYLAWARGSEGGERARLSAAKLGGLAKYVTENDVEPKDHDGELNTDLLDLAIDEIPEEPSREGRAAPSILPYIVIVAAGVAIFLTMWKVVNPPIRDDAIFEAVTQEPIEPGALRAYLVDERNVKHRKEVADKLAGIYAQLIGKVRGAGSDPTLREGMAQILDSIKGPDQPTVSLKVTEERPKAGATERVKKLRDDVVGKIEEQRVNASSKDPDYFTARGGIFEELARMMPPVQPPMGMTFPTPRTAVGLQMIEFADKPEDAQHAHFEITYEFVQIGNTNSYSLSVKVEFRTNLDGDPVATYEERSGQFGEGQFDQQLRELKDRLIAGMVGKWGGQGMFAPPPGIPLPNIP